MKNVLIICDFFPPGFAPRMGYLTKYIGNYGYNAIVLTTAMATRRDNANFSHLNNYAKQVYWVNVDAEEQTKHLMLHSTLLNKLVFFVKPDYNRPPALNEKMLSMADEIFSNHKIDVILCSTSGIFPLGVASELSLRYNIPWVADIRDIIEQGLHRKISIREKIVNIRSIYRRNYLLRQADSVVTISEWHKNYLSKINPKVELIYNGFDPELYHYVPPQSSKMFTITFAGTLITGKLYQDPTMFFEAVGLLNKERKIKNSDFVINCFTYPIGIEYISSESKKYGIESYFRFSEFIEAIKIPEVLYKSSILLMFANKQSKEGPHGVLTTKLFEYLGTCRPILCVRSDASYIEKIINTHEAGMAARSVQDVYNFLLHKYEQWKQNKIVFTPNDSSNRLVYSRKEQAKQFVNILNVLTNNNAKL